MSRAPRHVLVRCAGGRAVTEEEADAQVDTSNMQRELAALGQEIAAGR